MDGSTVASITITNPGRDYIDGDIVTVSSTSGQAKFKITHLQAGPTNINNRVVEEHDIDLTSLEYIEKIQNEIAKDVPDAKTIDKKTL